MGAEKPALQWGAKAAAAGMGMWWAVGCVGPWKPLREAEVTWCWVMKAEVAAAATVRHMRRRTTPQTLHAMVGLWQDLACDLA